LPVRETLAGRRLLVTGASGFLGKVWLAHLLCEVGTLGEVHLVLRSGRFGSAHARLEDLLATCPAFAPVHERFGAEAGDVLGQVLRAHDGDLTLPRFGLAPDVVEALRGKLDLIVHLGGLTTLDPVLDEALAANVDGALHALDLARHTGARLLHVSTCYVAGARRGTVPEAWEADAVPRPPQAPASFSARAEREALQSLVRRLRAEADDQQVRAERTARAKERLAALGGRAEDLARFEARERDAWLRERLTDEGRDRARAWGWPNAYTLSKSLAESLLREERGDVPVSIVRPSIVESAQAFPFPGWKEGLQTSAPLTYALTRGPLRALPGKAGRVLDVIPVDHVARGLTLAAAALIADPQTAPDVVQLGSSGRNPLPLERVMELTSLAHRRLEPDRGRARHLVADAVPTSPDVYRRTSVPLLRKLAGEVRELASLASEALPDLLGERLAARPAKAARKLARELGRSERRLATLEEEVERFRPFVLDHDHVFACDAARDLEARLDDEERAAFAADPADLDWRGYWLDVHVPGLRRWIYPKIEGKAVERWPRTPVRLANPSPTSAS
jgi:long-chain acyl-CoA synthetase